ncbi:hypothetical protein U1Q18_040793 [Sarracenia purpurea var. burkii]
MDGSESSEEGPEPFETELADEVNCSVYGSNVNYRELDVLDVNSDCPAKIRFLGLLEVLAWINLIRVTKRVSAQGSTKCHNVFVESPLAYHVEDPMKVSPQTVKAFGTEERHRSGHSPSWADIVAPKGSDGAHKVDASSLPKPGPTRLNLRSFLGAD